MRRRSFLSTVSVGCIGVFSGCLSDSDTDVEEYRIDDQNTTTKSVGSPNELSERAMEKTLQADTDGYTNQELGYPNIRSHPISYSYNQVNVNVNPDGEVLKQMQNGKLSVQAVTRRYPDGDIVGRGVSDVFVPDSISTNKTIKTPIDYTKNVLGETVDTSLHFRQSIEENRGGLFSFDTVGDLFAATDPYEITENGIKQYNPSYNQESDIIRYEELTTSKNHPQTGIYRIENVEGGYFITYSTTTPQGFPELPTVPIFVSKRTYGAAKEENRPRKPEPIPERRKYVVESINQERSASFLGSIFDIIFKAEGYESDDEKIELISTFVQSLPYALDPIDTGYDDYSQYPSETLVEGNGDCEDVSILLASGLLESNIDCSVAFLGFGSDSITNSDSGHLSVGVAPKNVEYNGYPYIRRGGKKYYYIEPTAYWQVGEVPDGIDLEGVDLYKIRV